MRDRFVCLISCVVVLTVASTVGATFVAFCGPSPTPLAMERLLDTFLSFAAAGFFSILGMLGALHGK